MVSVLVIVKRRSGTHRAPLGLASRIDRDCVNEVGLGQRSNQLRIIANSKIDDSVCPERCQLIGQRHMDRRRMVKKVACATHDVIQDGLATDLGRHWRRRSVRPRRSGSGPRGARGRPVAR